MWIFKVASDENKPIHRLQGKLFVAACWIAIGDGCGNVDIENDCVKALVCVDSVWYFKPCFDTKDELQTSH